LNLKSKKKIDTIYRICFFRAAKVPLPANITLQFQFFSYIWCCKSASWHTAGRWNTR
jgi:hypothetical protein